MNEAEVIEALDSSDVYVRPYDDKQRPDYILCQFLKEAYPDVCDAFDRACNR